MWIHHSQILTNWLEVEKYQYIPWVWFINSSSNCWDEITTYHSPVWVYHWCNTPVSTHEHPSLHYASLYTHPPGTAAIHVTLCCLFLPPNRTIGFFLLHKDDSDRPMNVIFVDWADNVFQLEDILPWHFRRPFFWPYHSCNSPFCQGHGRGLGACHLITLWPFWVPIRSASRTRMTSSRL